MFYESSISSNISAEQLSHALLSKIWSTVTQNAVFWQASERYNMKDDRLVELDILLNVLYSLGRIILPLGNVLVVSY